MKENGEFHKRALRGEMPRTPQTLAVQTDCLSCDHNIFFSNDSRRRIQSPNLTGQFFSFVLPCLTLTASLCPPCPYRLLPLSRLPCAHGHSDPDVAAPTPSVHSVRASHAALRASTVASPPTGDPAATTTTPAAPDTGPSSNDSRAK